MGLVRSPQSGAEVNAEGAAFERFVAAGWTVVEPSIPVVSEPAVEFTTDSYPEPVVPPFEHNADAEDEEDGEAAIEAGELEAYDEFREGLEAEGPAPGVDTWDEAELRAFAETQGIALGKLKNVDKIRERIKAALAERD